MKLKNPQNFLLPAALGILFISVAGSAAAQEQPAHAPSMAEIPYSFKNPFTSLLPKPEPEVTKETAGAFEEPAPDIAQIPSAIIQPPQLQINGLVWNSDRPQAIINNDIVTIGDVVAEAKILDITRNGVRIEYKGEHFEIDPNKNAAEPSGEIN